MSTELVAFNYATQTWERGPAARALLVSQLEDELAILRSPRANDYVAFTQKRGERRLGVDEAIALAESALRELA